MEPDNPNLSTPDPPPGLKGYLVQGIPLIREGDRLGIIIAQHFPLEEGDVVCVASTIVAKAEGRARNLQDYTPSNRAWSLAEALEKDPRFVQAVLEESAELLLEKPFLLVVTPFGHICVNAGIDQSNVDKGKILLLPQDPQSSADRIRMDLGKNCAVIITDTCGRPFRCGVSGVALGAAGISALRDWRGELDLNNRPLEITQEAIADEIAGMANMLMGEAGAGTPCAVLRGLSYPTGGGRLFRPAGLDIIRSRLRTGKPVI